MNAQLSLCQSLRINHSTESNAHEILLTLISNLKNSLTDGFLQIAYQTDSAAGAQAARFIDPFNSAHPQ